MDLTPSVVKALSLGGDESPANVARSAFALRYPVLLGGPNLETVLVGDDTPAVMFICALVWSLDQAKDASPEAIADSILDGMSRDAKAAVLHDLHPYLVAYGVATVDALNDQNEQAVDVVTRVVAEEVAGAVMSSVATQTN